jgi:hypothetical protein
MVELAYTAIETFDPSDTEAWTKYIEWSGLHHLKEVISLDCMLCPSVIADVIDEDWNHKSYEYIFHDLFTNLDYLQVRVTKQTKYQIIATVREPESAIEFPNSRFTFKGYDLIDEETRISALTNCGGFDEAFSKDDLSECGLLITDYEARNVRERLSEKYPDEAHADCSIWAIWRLDKDA